MRCLSALVKTEAGLNAVINSRKLVCQAFASKGGSLLLADAESLRTPAVKVLSAVAVFSPEGHRVALDSLDELYFSHSHDLETKPRRVKPLPSSSSASRSSARWRCTRPS